MKRILGVDWGARWIGLALSDPMQIIASPAGRCEVRSPEEAFRAVQEAMVEHDVEAVVVGVPYNMDGSVGEMGRIAMEFAKKLEALSGMPVHSWDERLTTVQAERALQQAGLTRKKRKARRDTLAAQFILQSYLDAKKRTESP